MKFLSARFGGRCCLGALGVLLAGCVAVGIDYGPERDAARAQLAEAGEPTSIEDRVRRHRAQLTLIAEAAESDKRIGRDITSAIKIMVPSDSWFVLSQMGCFGDLKGIWKVRDQRSFRRDDRTFDEFAARCGDIQDRHFVFDTTLWSALSMAVTAAGEPPEGFTQADVDYVVNRELSRSF
jgi:hypothetical protein